MEEAVASVGVVGPRLTPFLSAFLEGPFVSNVRCFVETHADEFAVTCIDGSYPLTWTTLHEDYCKLFERQLISAVQEEGFSRDDFRDYMVELQRLCDGLKPDDALPGFDSICVFQFNTFVDALTASTDFEKFRNVMFATVISRQRVELAHAATQEIEVIVPEGYGAGHVLAIDFLGARYELEVPSDCGPGSTFRALVTIPSASPAE
eukprot:TRINITY_DN49694_c0_g1_i1.p1 TRINITY_DN49694_c0_g1~~TRINITY_DN49694_c0_g1_i1.p1  ORF type:complete len:222 (-),score=25.72 TRINITY_DN49694_c0_g1_i1:146-763(-)